MKKFSELSESIGSDIKARREANRQKSLSDAADRYDHHKKQALRHLELLKRKINDAPVGNLNWGHVGSMEEVHHQLRRLSGSGHVG